MSFSFQIHGNLNPTEQTGERKSAQKAPPECVRCLTLRMSQLLGEFVTQPTEEKVLLPSCPLFAQKIRQGLFLH